MKTNLANKILIFSLILITPFVLGQGLHADEVLSINVDKSTQSGKDYSIPLNIKIRSSLDSDKFELNVETSPGLVLRENPSLFVSVKADTDYELIYHLDPIAEGDYKVFVKGQLWQADTNYRDVDSIEIKINSDLEMEPVSSDFLQGRRNNAIWGTLINITIITTIIGLIIFGILRFKKYIDAEDKKR